MVTQTFELPDLGEGIAEGELVSWAVQPGDTVEEDQVVAEVETDKALVDVPSPYDGVVAELHADEGDVVPVDSVIVTFEVADAADAESVPATNEDESDGATGGEASESAAGDSPSKSGRVFASPSTRSLARELGVDLTAVEGSGAGGRVSSEDVRAASESRDEGAADADDGTAAAAVDSRPVTDDEGDRSERDEGDGGRGPATAAEGGQQRARTLAMPATRRLARERGIDIDAVPATERRDGEAFVTPEAVSEFADRAERSATEGAARSTASDAGADADAATTGERNATAESTTSGERVPYKGVRRAIGDQMARSKYTAPHVSHHDRFDAAELVAVRSRLADVADREGVKLTYLPFVVKAVTAALESFPALNASLDETAEEIVLHDDYHIGIAVATDAGLMVPVVRHADRKGLKQLATEIEDLATRARDRDLSPEEMRGSTFTITNIGVIGGEFASPIINYPEAAILAMGPIQKRPWVVDDEVVPRETMTLSMSLDHRLVDGAEAAQFTNRVMELLGDPERLLLE
jgi:pyruvate dehydrogenase E2 component (dihydrolipoamide acetyltransferase)